MPFAFHSDARIFWRLEGEVDLPPLVLLHSIGTDMSVWDRGVPTLLRRFRLLRIDLRGHGASDAPDGDYEMAAMACDVVAAMDAAGIDSAAVAGVSLGGMVAMQLALDHPGRILKLALVCTTASSDRAMWEERVMAVRAHGMEAVADVAMDRFLSPSFAAAEPAAAASVRTGLLRTPPQGYAGAAAAIRDMTLLRRLAGLKAATLVIGGDRDVSMPFAEHGGRIAEAVPGSQVVHLDAAHLAPVEAPVALAAALTAFLLPTRPAAEAEDASYAAGLRSRRRVLGDEWVDASLARRTAFTTEFQAMITRTAWAEVWSRPGLDDRTRRLVAVAITASLGRWEEFRLHVRMGLRMRGFSADELKEVLMQTAVYAGVPAANSAFNEAVPIVEEELHELERQ